jgi:hypothetical protein
MFIVLIWNENFEKTKEFFCVTIPTMTSSSRFYKTFLQTFRDKLARFLQKKLSLISQIFMTYLLAYFPTI